MRTKRILTAIFIITLGFTAHSATIPGFPEMAGWEKAKQPMVYNADNLFEYINGAAEVFLSYDFRELFSTTYTSPSNQSVTADIYVHADSRNGFGIYSQEKPLAGEFLALGTEGYYESGVLNFFQGRFYIKISAFDLGADDRRILTELARGIAAGIPDEAEFPMALAAFPVKDRVPHSRRFINSNFLGHSFLRNAFTCEYRRGEQTLNPFILETASGEEAQKTIESYLEFARQHGEKPEEVKDGVRFTDPYYRTRGPLTLRRRGRYIWGVFSPDTKETDNLLDAMGGHFPEPE